MSIRMVEHVIAGYGTEYTTHHIILAPWHVLRRRRQPFVLIGFGSDNSYVRRRYAGIIGVDMGPWVVFI
jgi:hypothetical protein